MDLSTRLAKLHQRIAKQELPPSAGVADFVMQLMHARTSAHVLHLQQSGPGSYARHMALGAFYEGIGDLVDSLVETYQGRHGLIAGYPSSYDAPPNEPVAFMQGVCEYVRMARASVPQESHLQNIVDEIQALADSTLYKLTYLA